MKDNCLEINILCINFYRNSEGCKGKCLEFATFAASTETVYQETLDQ